MIGPSVPKQECCKLCTRLAECVLADGIHQTLTLLISQTVDCIQKELNSAVCLIGCCLLGLAQWLQTELHLSDGFLEAWVEPGCVCEQPGDGITSIRWQVLGCFFEELVLFLLRNVRLTLCEQLGVGWLS